MEISYEPIYPLGILTNTSEQYPLGVGYTVNQGEQQILHFTDSRFAKDFYWLSVARLVDAEKSGLLISETDFLALSEHIEIVEESLQNLEYSKANYNANLAFRYGRRFYVYLTSSMKDTLGAIPFFTFLLVVRRKYIPTERFVIVLFCIGMIFITQCLTFDFWPFSTMLGFLLRVFIGYAAFRLVKGFPNTYIRVMFYICLISLFFHLFASFISWAFMFFENRRSTNQHERVLFGIPNISFISL